MLAVHTLPKLLLQTFVSVQADNTVPKSLVPSHGESKLFDMSKLRSTMPPAFDPSGHAGQMVYLAIVLKN